MLQDGINFPIKPATSRLAFFPTRPQLTVSELQTFRHKGAPRLVDTSLLERPSGGHNKAKTVKRKLTGTERMQC